MAEFPGETLPEGWDIRVRYKPIRNIWFRADHRRRLIRVSAPAGIRPGALERALRSKARWMASTASREAVPRLIPEGLHTGDTCLVRGISCPVSVLENAPEKKVVFCPGTGLELRMKGNGSAQAAARMVADWYRKNLTSDLPPLIETWESLLGLRVNEVRIRRMKTRWGSCNIRAKRIWVNLALACLAPDLLEYVVVHELLHLLEPSHNARFYRLMQEALPDWQARKTRLSSHAPGLA